MVDVILINPLAPPEGRSFVDSTNYPIGLLCLGTMLEKNGYRVEIVDGFVDKDYEEKIIKTIQNGVIYAGISVMTAQIAVGIYISQIIRRINHTTPIVWGGIHVTLLPEQALSDPLCDIVVIGEGDYTCVELAEALKYNKDLSQIKGIGYKKNGKMEFTSRREIVDIEDLPPINYNLVDIEKYTFMDFDKKYGLFGKNEEMRRMTFHTARGCPYRCTFCINPLIYPEKRKYRAKSPQSVLDEIEFNVKKYTLNFISFGDDLFFANKKRAEVIVEELIKRRVNVKWYANVKADYFRPDYLNESFLKKLKAAGCIRFSIGAESGSERMHGILKKGITPRHIINSADLVKNHRILIGYSFMTGIPGETKEDMAETLKIMLKLKEINPFIYFIGPQLFRPYPGSELYLKCVEGGFKNPESLREWGRIPKTFDGANDIRFSNWVSNPDFVEYVGLFVLINFNIDFELQSIAKRFIYKILRLAMRLRAEFDFWFFFHLELIIVRLIRI